MSGNPRNRLNSAWHISSGPPAFSLKYQYFPNNDQFSTPQCCKSPLRSHSHLVSSFLPSFVVRSRTWFRALQQNHQVAAPSPRLPTASPERSISPQQSGCSTCRHSEQAQPSNHQATRIEKFINMHGTKCTPPHRRVEGTEEATRMQRLKDGADKSQST